MYMSICLNVYELKSQTVVSHQMGTGNGTWVLCQSSHCSLSLSITEPSLQSQGARPLTTEPSPYCDKCISIYRERYAPLNNILHLPGRVSFRGCWQCCSALSVEQEAALGVYWLQCCFSQGTSEPPCLDGQLWKVFSSPVHVQPTELIYSSPCACFYFLWFSSLSKFPHWVAL